MGASSVKMDRKEKTRRNVYLRAAELAFLDPTNPAPITCASFGNRGWISGSYEQYLKVFGDPETGHAPARHDYEHRITALCMAHAMRVAGDL